jgi:hypothetical protein
MVYTTPYFLLKISAPTIIKIAAAISAIGINENLSNGNFIAIASTINKAAKARRTNAILSVFIIYLYSVSTTMWVLLGDANFG